MNFKWWLKYTIKVLITPSCWIRDQSTSKVWDMRFLKLLEENKWERPEPYTACLGNIEIWTSSHPYASFSAWNPVRLRVIPSRKTSLYAMDRLERESARR